MSSRLACRRPELAGPDHRGVPLRGAPTVGIVDTLPSGTALDYVGYGATYQVHSAGVRPFDRWTGGGIRTYAPGQLMPFDHFGLATGEYAKYGFSLRDSSIYMKVTSNPGDGKGGIANGDSGGPHLLGGTDTVLGTLSLRFAADPNYTGAFFDTRLDVQAFQDWINSFIGK
jgi:hypothetical protein